MEKVFHNARIYTTHRAANIAQAMAVTGGRVLAVGSEDEIRSLAGPHAEWIDLGGRAVVPGLIDSHNHIFYRGIAATRAADLSGSDSISEILRRLQAFSDDHPDAPWLLGERFDQELLAEARWPTRADLDRVSPHKPAMITRLCLHAVVANTAALEPVRGQLSAEQSATGLLTEDATEAVWSQIPPPTSPQLREAALWALDEARRAGLAGVHAIVSDGDELRVLRRLRDEGLLPVRINVLCPLSMREELVAEGLRTGSGDHWLRVGALKIFVDGAMGARTAAMRRPFADDPRNTGQLFRNERDIAAILRDIQPQGFQASLHAIGDLAIECALEGIRIASPGGLRHRIEHASQMAPDLIEKMASLGVLACVQPQFITTDFWTRDRVGPERYRWSYPFGSMLHAGITLAMGSDSPVERVDPIELIDRAVNRELHSLPERLTVEQTLRAYSHGSAYAGFDEMSRGTLEPGKLADFAVLSQDVYRIDPERISETTVDQSVVGGEMRW